MDRWSQWTFGVWIDVDYWFMDGCYWFTDGWSQWTIGVWIYVDYWFTDRWSQ